MATPHSPSRRQRPARRTTSSTAHARHRSAATRQNRTVSQPTVAEPPAWEGKIIEVNKDIAGDLDTLKEEPFEDGWLVRIKPSDPSELESLMTKKEYEEFLESSEEDEEDEKKEKEKDEDVDEDDFV